MSYTIKTPFNASQNSEEKINELSSTIGSFEIDSDFKAAYSNYYHEITYNSGNVSSIDIWENSGKTTKLFTKALTYDGTTGNLTQIVVTDEVNSSTLTKAFTYDVNGNLQTITRTYA